MRYDLLVWVLAFFTGIIGMFIYPDGSPDAMWLNVTLTGSVLMFIFWVYSSERERHGNWLHPIILFSFSYLIVFFQVPWCVAHGYDLPAFYYPFPMEINRCASIAFLGLASFYLGYCWFSCFSSNPPTLLSYTHSMPLSPGGVTKTKRILLAICWLLFFVFIKLAGAAFYLTFIYDGGASWGAGAAYVNTLLYLVTGLVTAIEAVRLSQLQIRSFREFISSYDRGILFFLFLSNLPYLLSGDRGTLLAMGFIVVTPYFLFFRPLKRREFFILLFATAIALTFLGKMRTRDISMEWGERFVKGATAVIALSNNPNEWPTIELGASYRCFNAAVGIVPSKYSYAQGRFLWGNFSSMIPFYQRIFPLYDENYIGNASLFFTNFLRSGDFSSGEGSAVLGATYLDFGVYGVPVILFLLGWVMALVTKKARQNLLPNAVLWMFLFLFAMFQAVKIARSDPFFWVQNAAWGALIFFTIVKPIMFKSRVFQQQRQDFR